MDDNKGSDEQQNIENYVTGLWPYSIPNSCYKGRIVNGMFSTCLQSNFEPTDRCNHCTCRDSLIRDYYKNGIKDDDIPF